MKKLVGLLGPGTFSEESAQHFLDMHAFEFVHYKYIADVFNATLKREVDYGIIPVENTMEGSVSLHLDLLVQQTELAIQGEWVYPIDMNLIGYLSHKHSSQTPDYSHLKKIYSHHVVPAQCSEFMRSYLAQAEFEAVGHTSEGVRIVAASHDHAVAAIGTKSAAKLYDLAILAAEIQDHKDNMTRFILIGYEGAQLPPSESMKTTVIVTLPEDYPGALHQMLSAFAWRKINLSKIESRPTKKKLGSYYFYIDLEGSMESILLQSAVHEIQALGCQVRLLGSYPSYTYQST